MFNPFFTTKPAGEGTGLGLSISHDIIVKQHGGTIAVDTKPGEFTEFTIVLPRNAASSGRPADGLILGAYARSGSASAVTVCIGRGKASIGPPAYGRESRRDPQKSPVKGEMCPIS